MNTFLRFGILVFVIAITSAKPVFFIGQTPTQARTVVSDLVIPWEIEFGPDGKLWTTERIGVMSRIDIETGEKDVILDKRGVVYTELETGMLGFTWHPDFPSTPFVYISYVGGVQGAIWRVVERYSWNGDTLTDPVELFRLDPAAVFHQGCRLNILPDGKLYVTMGDAPTSADGTEDSTVIGKILRMNLDGSVPDDNPVPGNLLYSKGHRNVQGFVRLPNGQIWTAEHGNVIEDEVNLLVPNGNYGWPYVEGQCDEPYELDYCDTANVLEPKWSSGTVSTVAPCALDYYNDDRYPSLKNSLLMCTLKTGTLFQFVLNEEGTDIIETREMLARSIGRLRDVAIHPDGRVFVCTSNQEPNGYAPFPYFHDDRVVELTFAETCEEYAIEFSDTTFVRGRTGEETWFGARVTNKGKCPFNVVNVRDVNAEGPFYRQQWRTPVAVLPGESYDLAMMYKPEDNAHNVSEVEVYTDKFPMIRLHFSGDTITGSLMPDTTKVLVDAEAGSIQSHAVTFSNVGNDTLRVLSGDIGGSDKDLFTVDVGENEVIYPGASFTANVRFKPVAEGLSSARMVVYSTGSETHEVVLEGIATPRSGDDGLDEKVQIFPNPFVDEVTFIVPDDMSSGSLTVHNALGQLVWTTPLQGSNAVLWNVLTDDNLSVPAGPLYITMYGTKRTLRSNCVRISR